MFTAFFVHWETQLGYKEKKNWIEAFPVADIVYALTMF